ncbi:hypothetical protein LLEC1_06464, partial [Akanthomyces lecanii]
MHTAHQTTVLERLDVAKGASFDSSSNEHESTCLADTRVEVLDEIQHWADDAGAESIFWLNGMAGTGKSTISRTVAESFAAQGRLGASFFFKRGEADRGTIAKFFPTLAADLVHRIPTIAPYIKDALDADSLIGTRNTRDQFDRLFFKAAITTQICEGRDNDGYQNDIKLLVHFFFRAKAELSTTVKIFLTSRPELPLRLEFVKGPHKGVILHDMPQPVIEHDIHVFLEHRLREIRTDFNASVTGSRRLCPDWPKQSVIQSLATMSTPLFIFAATVCLFIAERKNGNPDKQLAKVLKHQASSQQASLGSTYLLVLRQQTAGLDPREEDKVLQEFREIVGPIVLLASPLSTRALSQLLDISQDNIDDRLDLLHSVLSVPGSSDTPVRLLHLSFRDFLVKPELREHNPFWIDQTQTHANIATRCLHLLRRLKQDICGMADPGISRSDMSAAKINSCLLPEVQYACLFWVHHLDKAKVTISDGTEAHPFLTQHFLHWMEALSLMDRAIEGLGLLRKLCLLVKENTSAEISLFLEDAVRFVQLHVSTISSTPLQLYSTLLIFTPKQNKVRTTFEDLQDVARQICLKPQLEDHWSNCLQMLDDHGDSVNSVAFSHNSTLLATSSCDKTVRIWRVETGECIQTLDEFRSSVNSVAFSHDSKLMASGSDCGEIRIWCAETAKCVQTLHGHMRDIEAVDFSHDSTLLASATSLDSTVRIWQVSTGECRQTLVGHGSSLTSIAFAGDSSLVASGSIDQTVRIWRADKGDCVQTLRGHSDCVEDVAFAHNSVLVASGSRDTTVRIWRVSTGECLQTLDQGCHLGFCLSVALSHDSTKVAAGSSDGTVRVWCVDTGECIETLQGHSDTITSVAFSHDSSLVASSSEDTIVRIWRANGAKRVQTLQRHDDVVISVALSYDLSLVASGSWDNTVRIWRTGTGECVQTLHGLGRLVLSLAWSHDSKLIASALAEGTLLIWRVDTGECVQMMKGYGSVIEFSPDSTLISLGSHLGLDLLCGQATGPHYAGMPRVWRVDTGKCVEALAGHGGAKSFAFSHDSKLVALADDDATVRICCVETGQCIQKMKAWKVNSMAFSHDSALIAIGCGDKTLSVCRVDTGEYVQRLQGHSDWTTSIAFSHDSALMASASLDTASESSIKTLQIWSTETWECRHTMRVDSGLWHLAFIRNSSHILSDVGTIAVRDGGVADSAVIIDRPGISISEDDRWITRDGKKLLWLPVDFRP